MNILFLILILILLFIIIELFLRFLKNKTQDKDFQNIKRIPSVKLSRSYEVKSINSERQNSQKCDILGWDLIKNTEINVKINVPYFKDNYLCKYKINSLGARSNIDEISSDRKLFGTFGCSVSYGYSLNEESTFSNMICNNLNDFDYLNFSVPGYSLYQSFIKYKLKSKDFKFDFIVLGIHKDLERRNTCSIEWVDIINNFWKIPRIYKIGKQLNFLPSSKSNYEIINKMKFFIGSFKFIQKTTMEHLLLEFKKECSKNNTKLYVICFDKYYSIYDFLEKNNFNWNSAHLNLEQKNQNNECVWQLMPWDNHPNEEANKIFAKKIIELIEYNKNNGEIFKPKISDIEDGSNPQKYIYPIW